MKTIAILGARGFVGKSLSEFLKDQYKVINITRNDFSITDAEAVKSFFQSNKVDVVINCANSGGSRKTGYDINNDSIVENNLRMFLNIERIMTPEMKFINFGSGAQYQKNRNLHKISEEEIGKVIPMDEYGYSKYVMSRLIERTDKKIYNPIIFGLFGKDEDYTFKFISNAIIKNLLKQPIIINQNVVFDYLYITDFNRIIKTLIESNEIVHNEFNITPTESIDLLTIVNLINQCGSYQSEIVVRNDGLNYEYTGDNKRLLENVGESFSFTSYRDAISDLYRYFELNLASIDATSIIKDESLKYCKTKNN